MGKKKEGSNQVQQLKKKKKKKKKKKIKSGLPVTVGSYNHKSAVITTNQRL
jgi:hypothetical protein